ncbi:hypothetical protein N9Z52_00675 [Akkermansiaceae bacterium]|nr:hypothetical protein [Akkermansiaceae bacterium]MDB4422189.1 hypothetical protein [Akkermansiaceae bacterium]MDB4617701.1 hypothetical protein [bacterium]
MMNIHEEKTPILWVLLGSILMLLLSMEATELRRTIELISNLALIVLISYFWYLMGPIIGLGILAFVDSKLSDKWASKMEFNLPKMTRTVEFLITYLIGTVYFIVVFCFWMIVKSCSVLNERLLSIIADLSFCILPAIGLFLSSKYHAS